MRFLPLAAASVLALASTASTGAEEDQYPTIHRAITTLEQTEQDLKTGEHGFGGHRSRAIEHIDAALSELHQALQFADEHPDAIKPAEK